MSSAVAAQEIDRNAEGARARATVLGFATDAESEAVLRDALTVGVAESVDIRRGDVNDAARMLHKIPSPHVLLVDITGCEQPLTALDELSQLVEPDVRVLAIGDRQDVSLYRGLTHGLGVLEYLFKPLTKEMVVRHFGPLIAQENAGARLLRGGRVISVTGVHGGAGATTIAANLAWYLADQASRHTLLLDSDLFGAAASMLLSVKPSPGLRAALDKPERVDDLFIDRTAQLVGERLHVLSGEGKVSEPPNVTPGALAALMEVLRRRFKFLVCDAAWPASSIGRDLFDVAHHRVLVTQPSVAGARDLLRYLAVPPPHHLLTPASPPFVILNQAGIKGGLNLEQFERAIGRKPDLVIPHLSALLEAANLGEPAASRNARFRKSMQDLAFSAASITQTAKRKSFWSRK
jgi:pilus assembly protein CpaE